MAMAIASSAAMSTLCPATLLSSSSAPSTSCSRLASCHGGISQLPRFGVAVGRDNLSLKGQNAARRAPCCMSVEVQDSEQDNVAGGEVAEVEKKLLEEQDSNSSSMRDRGIEEPMQIDSRRGLEEKFAVINTGKHECRSCGHVYEEAKGDSSFPISPGTLFTDLPGDWRCPTCGAAKSYFQSKSVEVAGFAQNQQFGLGGNSLTAGQKSLLIYGALLAFFALFLSGYFLQ